MMQQLGHTDPQMTLGLYARALKSKRRRADRDEAPSRARTGTEGLEEADGAVEVVGADYPKPALEQGLREERLKGLEPSTFCMASRRSSQLSYSRATRRV